MRSECGIQKITLFIVYLKNYIGKITQLQNYLQSQNNDCHLNIKPTCSVVLKTGGLSWNSDYICIQRSQLSLLMTCQLYLCSYIDIKSSMSQGSSRESILQITSYIINHIYNETSQSLSQLAPPVQIQYITSYNQAHIITSTNNSHDIHT